MKKQDLKLKLLQAQGGKILITPAQKAFNGVAILTERPHGMSYQEFKKLRRIQTKAIKNAIR
jgi:hypothetical protein